MTQVFLNQSRTEGSSFTRFVIRELAVSLTYVRLTHHGFNHSFLVLAPQDDARCEGVDRHSVCTISRAVSSNSVSCTSVRCRRGKNKKLANVSDISSLCCHLRALLPQLGLTSGPFVESDDNDSGFLLF